MKIPALILGALFTRSVIVSFSNTPSNNIPIFTNNNGSDSLAAVDTPPGCDWNPLPGDLTIQTLAVHAITAVTGDFVYQPFKGIPKVDTGSSVTVTSGNTDAEGAVAVTVSAPAVAADLATQAIGWTGVRTSGSGSINARPMFKYSIAPPYNAYNIHSSGFSNPAFFISQATRFMALHERSSSTTEGDVQVAVAKAGTYKYMLIVMLCNTTTSDSTYTAAFRVNGSSIISTTLTNSATAIMARETSTGATVAAGDLVDWRFDTSGTFDNAHRCRIYASIGFLPS